MNRVLLGVAPRHVPWMCESHESSGSPAGPKADHLDKSVLFGGALASCRGGSRGPAF